MVSLPRPSIDLTGRVAVVTGAGGGIGRAVTLALAGAGARVLAVDIDEGKAVETAAMVTEGGGEAVAMRADVTRSEDVAGYVRAAMDRWGRIDVFMNNAGWQGPIMPLVDVPEDAFDAVMAVNVKGVFLGLKHVLPVMIAQRSGAVVNTASLASRIATRQLGPYVASKHAVLGLTRTAALEVARNGVRVNAVCPGPVDTPLMRDIEVSQSAGDFEALRKRRTATIPQGRYATPEEVAGVMLFLASDLAAHMVGEGVNVNGGSFS
jgi:NAD(P)-dependent dehydrogenase (short-subunit alcohol dehydrogenase family)